MLLGKGQKTMRLETITTDNGTQIICCDMEDIQRQMDNLSVVIDSYLRQFDTEDGVHLQIQGKSTSIK